MIRRLLPAVKHYPWGEPEWLPALLGAAADGRPWAEAWYGTHPDGETRVETVGATGAAPVDGARGAGRSLRDEVGELPYLVKWIAVAAPLSLQTHPTAAAARAGWEAEEARGVPRDAAERTYRDASDKPELLCAIGDFTMIAGFVDADEARLRLAPIGLGPMADAYERLGRDAYVRRVLRAGADELRALAPDAVLRGTWPGLPAWAAELGRRHPGDRGVAVALVMRHVALRDGDAVLLRPGVVHAYLRGRAVEVMASSDNVVRAAFTTKRVDVEAFVRTATCDGAGPEWVASAVAPAPDGAMRLARVPFGVARHAAGAPTEATHDVEIALCAGPAGGRERASRADVRRARGADTMRAGEVRLLRRGERAVPGPGASIVRVWAA